MYTNPVFLKKVRRLVLVEGASLGSTARKFRMSRAGQRPITDRKRPLPEVATLELVAAKATIAIA